MGAPWPGRCHKTEFTGDGSDAMQGKRKNRSGSFNEKLEGSSLRSGASKKIANGSKYCRTTKQMVHPGKARDGPRHGGESAKGPGERK